MSSKTAMTSTTHMTAQSILEEITPLGRDTYKKVLFNHGVTEPCLGVKIEDLKKIQKRVKMDYQLALDLYDTGVYDAMYLAGLIADDARMTRKDLKRWIEKAHCPAIAEYTVPWVAAGNPLGWEMGLEWIDSKKERVAAAGWQTLSGIVGTREDAALDMAALKRLVARVEKTIHDQPNRVRYVMNSFIIAVGGAVVPLTGLAIEAAKKIGDVEVDMGETSCKVPSAAAYIEKIRKRGAHGKKRKSVKC